MVKTNPKTKRTRFQISLPDAKLVTLVGDFNGWDASTNPMKKDSKGNWKTKVKLPKGENQFRYLVDGKEWYNDAECSTVQNSYRSENSVINVKYI